MTTTPESEIPAFTARRVNRGSKAIVQILDADGDVWAELGGNRAERARAALVTLWPANDKPGVSGLRQDLHAAEVEAHRLVTATEMKTRPRFGNGTFTIPLNRPTWAIAIPVADEVPNTQPPKESTTMASTTTDLNTEKDAAMTAAAEGTDTPKAKRGATVTWTIEGAPPAGKTEYHLARLALQCTSGIREGVKHIPVADLRTMLAEAGITDPEHTTWSFTLPNGRTIGAIANGEPVPEAKARRTPAAAKSASKGKGADRVAALNAKKAAAKAARDAGHPIPDEQLKSMTAEQADKVAEARRTHKAPAAKAS